MNIQYRHEDLCYHVLGRDGWGLTGVAGSLGAIVLAMNLMPSKSKMLTTGLGILHCLCHELICWCNEDLCYHVLGRDG